MMKKRHYSDTPQHILSEKDVPLILIVALGFIVLNVSHDNKSLVNSLLTKGELCYTEDPEVKVSLQNFNERANGYLFMKDGSYIALADLDVCPEKEVE